jgi:GT2 family glycosyltransferase
MGTNGIQQASDVTVTCIVVNWNGGAMLRECPASLRAQDFADQEIILVDNGSNDGSWEIAQREFAEVIALREAENLGLASSWTPANTCTRA